MSKDTQRMIIIGVFVGLILSAWLFVFYLPNHRIIKKFEKEKQSLLGNLGRDITQQEIDHLSNDLEVVNRNLDDRKKRIYPVSELNRLGDFFIRAGRDRDLKLVEISPTFAQISQLLVSQEGIISLPMSLEYVGPFSGITRFIDEFDKLAYIFKIESYSIRINEAEKTNLDLTIAIQMFFNNTNQVDHEKK